MSGQRLSTEEIEAIAQTVFEKLSGSDFIERERHWREHEWVRLEIESRENSKSQRSRIFEKIVGGIGTIGILGICTWVGHSIITTIADLISKVGP